MKINDAAVHHYVTVIKYSPTILATHVTVSTSFCLASRKLTSLRICRCGCATLLSAGHTERRFASRSPVRQGQSEGLLYQLASRLSGCPEDNGVICNWLLDFCNVPDQLSLDSPNAVPRHWCLPEQSTLHSALTYLIATWSRHVISRTRSSLAVLGSSREAVAGSGLKMSLSGSSPSCNSEGLWTYCWQGIWQRETAASGIQGQTEIETTTIGNQFAVQLSKQVQSSTKNTTNT